MRRRTCARSAPRRSRRAPSSPGQPSRSTSCAADGRASIVTASGIPTTARSAAAPRTDAPPRHRCRRPAATRGRSRTGPRRPGRGSRVGVARCDHTRETPRSVDDECCVIDGNRGWARCPLSGARRRRHCLSVPAQTPACTSVAASCALVARRLRGRACSNNAEGGTMSERSMVTCPTTPMDALAARGDRSVRGACTRVWRASSILRSTCGSAVPSSARLAARSVRSRGGCRASARVEERA